MALFYAKITPKGHQGITMQDIRWKQRFENFEKAFSNLNLVVVALKKEQSNIIYKMAAVQAYEMAFELAWKTLKDFLIQEGLSVTTPKDAIKEGFAAGILTDGEAWIQMLDDRNLTSHIYDEKQADKITDRIKNQYFILLTQFKEKFQGKL